MADKESTIRTIFAIDGHTQYKDAIKGINSEQTLLRSEMSKITAEYQLNGDKIQYNQGKVENLNKQIDLQKQKVSEANHAVEQSTQKFGEGSTETNRYTGELNRAEAQLMRLEKQLQEATRELKLSEDATYQAGLRMQETGKKWQESGDKMASVGKKLTLGVTTPIAAIGTVAAKSAIDFETGMAGVRKTTDMTTEELEDMSQALRDMSKEIPVSVTELTTLTETAGQLGIEKENLVDFTRVMADLGVASNIAGQDGATAMAQFANITKMAQTDFDRMGSSIVELGNNTATTEKDILNMATRLASAGHQANMSEADILGIAAGLASLGLEAQAGGSAFSKVINNIQLEVDTGGDKLEDFARVAGMSAGEFSTAWGENAAEALSKFIVGLGDTERHGKSTNEILDELGITELRMGDALRRTSGASDLFNGTLEMSNRAWKDNNALTTEASILYGTTESKLTIAKNKMNDAAIDMGNNLLPVISNVAEWAGDLVSKFTDLPEGTQSVIIKMGALAAALGPILTIGGNVQKVFGKITEGIGGIVSAAGEAIATDSGFTGFINSLSGASKAGLVGAAAAAVGGLVLLIKKLTETPAEVKAVQEAFDNANKSISDTAESVMAQGKQIDFYRGQVEELLAVENKDEAQKKRLASAIDALNELVPELTLEYDEQANILNRTWQEIDNVIEAEKRRIVESAKNKILEEALAAQTDTLIDIGKETTKLQQLEESRANIEMANAKLRATGLDDEAIRRGFINDAYKASNDLTEEQKRLFEELGLVVDTETYNIENFTDASTKGWNNSTTAVDLLGKEIDKTSGLVEVMQGEFDKHTDAIERNKDMLLENIDAQMGLGEAAESSADAVAGAEETKAGVITEGADAQTDAINGVSDAYKEEAKAVEEYLKEIERLTDENIQSMSGFSQKRLDLSTTTKEDFMQNLLDEQTAFNEYHTNLQDIASRVGPDVAEELEKLGADAAPLVAQFADGSDEDLKKLKTIFRDRQSDANKAAINKLGELPEQASNSMGKVKTAIKQSDLWGEGETQGANLVNGTAQGIRRNQQNAINAAINMANQVAAASSRAFDIRSPSHVFEDQGEQLPAGVAVGVRKRTKDAVDAIKDMSRDVSNVGINSPVIDPYLQPLPSLGRITGGGGNIIPFSSGGSTVNNSADNRLTVNVTVPPGETEDFGRRVGIAIANQLQNRAVSLGM